MAKKLSVSDYIMFAVIGLMALAALFVAILPIFSGMFGSEVKLFDDGWKELGEMIGDFNVVHIAYIITFVAALVAVVVVVAGFFMNNKKVAQLGMLVAIVAGIASIVGLIFSFIACGNELFHGALDVGSGAIIATILAVIGSVAASYKLLKK